jgi:hypothetical protein
MRENQSVSEMATEVLARQAAARAEQTGEPLEVALGNVLQTEAGRRLEKLREGDHDEERADEWQTGLPRERAEERERERSRKERRQQREEERVRDRRAAWESFIREERREIKLRKKGQLAEMLRESLAGELSADLRRLASLDRRQAAEGLVALTSNGKVHYKPVEELEEKDMEARLAAIRLRETWLKNQRDRWLEYGGSQG